MAVPKPDAEARQGQILNPLALEVPETSEEQTKKEEILPENDKSLADVDRTDSLTQTTSDLENGKLVEGKEGSSASEWTRSLKATKTSSNPKVTLTTLTSAWTNTLHCLLCALAVFPEAAGNTADDNEDGDVRLSQPDFARRSPWLRAALLGAQDGLISVASLMIGVGAVKEDHASMFVSGLAGLVAGSCSMAIGEFVSVHTQRDIEEASITAKKEAYSQGPERAAKEQEELALVYVSRGLSLPLAKQVAAELCEVNPIRAHARDELGIDMDDMSNPVQAALASGTCFIAGGIVPLMSAAFIRQYWIRLMVVVLVSTWMFILFGGVSAWLGGARIKQAASRTAIGGLGAIGVTFAVLSAFGASEII